MNTAILITSLFFFSLALYFAYLVATRSTKTYVRNRLTSYKRQVKTLKVRVDQLEAQFSAIEIRTKKGGADAKSPNIFTNMEDRHAEPLKQVVQVNGVTP